MRLPFRIGGLLTETDGDYGQHYRENEQKRNIYIQHSGNVPVPVLDAVSLPYHCIVFGIFKVIFPRLCMTDGDLQYLVFVFPMLTEQV